MIVAGIDVGGRKRGFHVAVLDMKTNQFLAIENYQHPFDVSNLLNSYPQLVCIAIDSPPKSIINGPNTRLAERHLNKLGFRIQWTRRAPMEPDEWMINGETLWDHLRMNVPTATLLETFPSAVSPGLTNCELEMPLKLFKGTVRERFGYKDMVDACICAWVAQKYVMGVAQSHGVTEDEVDELGPIWT